MTSENKRRDYKVRIQTIAASSSSSCTQPRGRRGTKTWRCNEDLLHSHEAKGKCLQQSVERVRDIYIYISRQRGKSKRRERKADEEEEDLLSSPSKEERQRREREREREKVNTMRYRKTPAANAARRRGRRYRLASAFPRRRYLPAADVSFLSSSSVSPPLLHYPRLLSSHVLTYPAPSPLPPSLFFSCLHPSPSRKSPSRLLFSPLYTLSPLDMRMYIYTSISLTRVRPPLVHSRLLFIPLRSPLSSVAIPLFV